MGEDSVRQALALDAQWVAGLRRAWLELMELAVWGEFRGARLGATGRMRRRALDAGEQLRSLTAARDWIPRPREQLKSALAAALNMEQSLDELEHAAGELEGADAAALGAAVSRLRTAVASHLPQLEARWAALLDSQYGGDAG